jgi:threonine synthase
MLDATRTLGALTGIFTAPEGGACFAAQQRLLAQGFIAPDETVVLFNTGTGLKYAHLWQQG